MITAIALDDERPALDVIETFCSRLDFIDLRRTFTRTDEARAYLAANPVDLLFSDINMPAESGIDFYRRADVSRSDGSRSDVSAIAAARPSLKPMVIFTTAYSEYAVESYELQAVDYLLKPFTFERFSQAVHKAYDQYKFLHQSDETQPTHLIFRVDYGLVKVAVADILFIEGLDNYLKIHLLGQRPVVVRLTMKAMLGKLPPQGFTRVHRSYIVSLDKVQSLRNKVITIQNTEIPISSTYESAVNAQFKDR